MPSSKDLDNPIPDRILERMAKKNQNFAEAAREIGTTQAALQYVVNRERGLGKELAPRIATYLGMDEGELFRLAGLAPGNDETSDDYHESQLRLLFKQATPQQRQQIVDVASIIIRGSEISVTPKTAKGKARGNT